MPKLSQTLFVPGSIQATQRKFVAVWALPLTNTNLDPIAEGISSLVASHQPSPGGALEHSIGVFASSCRHFVHPPLACQR
jgi:hypothetical protein